ncbi:MAG TPA: hypothetical protein VL137_09960 [Polyangiaceae bacterium]|nr:hypothetical protein [Polyangiaceae bacterium]
MKRLLLSLILIACCFASRPAHAAGYFGSNPEAAPSVFTYAWRGFTLGAIDGLALGYIIARDNGYHKGDWKPLVYGAGIGALAGSGVGFTLGFIDLADNRPGTAGIVLRDMVYGMGFGVFAGALTGALFMIDSKKPEHILFGASVGALAGTGVGMVVGFIEGPVITNSASHRRAGSNDLMLRPTLGATQDYGNNLVLTPGFSARF